MALGGQQGLDIPTGGQNTLRDMNVLEKVAADEPACAEGRGREGMRHPPECGTCFSEQRCQSRGPHRSAERVFVGSLAKPEAPARVRNVNSRAALPSTRPPPESGQRPEHVNAPCGQTMRALRLAHGSALGRASVTRHM